MYNFNFYMPAKVLFGLGKPGELHNEKLPGKKALIVTSNVGAYKNGCTCSQSVIAAFAEDMGISPETVYRLMEGFGGFGRRQEVCGAFSVISFYCSSGTMDGKSKAETYKVINRLAELYEERYGSIVCREILHGEKLRPFKCGGKVADAVIAACKVISEVQKNG